MTKKGRIVCLGDSLTYGYGIQPYCAEKAWPSLLEAYGCHVINAGVPGASLLAEGGYWNSEIYQKAMKKKPDAVILWLGANDSSKELWNEKAFESGYALLVEDLLEHVTRDRLLLVEPLMPRSDVKKQVYDFGIRSEPLKTEDQIIRKNAGLFGVSCFDPNDSLKNHPQLFTDDVHPDAEGNRILAEQFLAELRKMGFPFSKDSSSAGH